MYVEPSRLDTYKAVEWPQCGGDPVSTIAKTQIQHQSSPPRPGCEALASTTPTPMLNVEAR